MARADSVENFSSEARVNLKLHNLHEVPRKKFIWQSIGNQVSSRLLPWKFRNHSKFPKRTKYAETVIFCEHSKTVPFLVPT